MKIWPGFREDEEPAKYTILFVIETTCTPLPSTPTVDRISSVVHQGVSRDGRFVVDVRVIKNKKATETQELDRFGQSARCNTLLLWVVGLYWLSFDIVCVLRGPLPALYSQGVGLQVS